MEVERVFKGSRIQKGYGVGGFFASLFRRAIPLFKSGGKYLAKKAVKTGMNTLHDIASGVEPRVAIKRRIADTSDEMLNDVKRKVRRKMVGGGRKVKRRRKKRVTKGKKKRRSISRKKIKDIFKV